jgi:hypothetical protein
MNKIKIDWTSRTDDYGCGFQDVYGDGEGCGDFCFVDDYGRPTGDGYGCSSTSEYTIESGDGYGRGDALPNGNGKSDSRLNNISEF